MKIVLINCFETYDIRANQVEKFFFNYGIKVDRVQSNFSHRSKKRIDKFNPNYTYINVPKYKKNLSVSRLFSHFVFSFKVWKYLMSNNPSIVYCLIPPNSQVFFLSLFYKKHEIFYDVIDLWPEAMPLGKFKNLRIVKLWSSLRDRYLNRARHIITECDYFKQHIEFSNKNLNLSTVYFYGGKAIDISDKEYNENKITFCYIGSINNLIDIDLINSFIKEFDKKVFLNIIGEGEKKDYFISEMREIGVTVEDYGTVFDDEEKKKIIKKSDFGLNIMKDTTKVGLTMKSIEYFKYGLPIVNNIPSDTWKFVNDYQIGINLDRNNISDCITKLGEISKAEYKIMQQGVKQLYSEEFSEKAFTKRMNTIFSDILGEMNY